MDNGVVFPHGLVVCVGQACNLKCIDCSNFAPFSDNNSKSYCVDDIIESLTILKRYVEPFECLQIQGGEPFVYAHLQRLVEWCVNSEMSNSILIATNGLIHPNEGRVDYLKHNKVVVRISNYLVDIEKTKESEEFYKSHGIKVSRYDFAGDNGEWFNTGRKDDVYIVNEDDAKERFKKCIFNVCLTLENKKLAYCSRAINAERVLGFSSIPGDYVLVEQDNDNIGKELRQYLKMPHHMQACKYCYGTFEKCAAGVQ